MKKPNRTFVPGFSQENRIDQKLAGTKKRRTRKWISAVLGLAIAAVMFQTLRKPAITIETQVCGMEEHVHTEACYGYDHEETAQETMTELYLACTFVPHVHTDACFDAEGKLTCGYSEEYIHVHDSSCYVTDSNGEQKLVCPLQGMPEHEHTDACYTRSLVCGEEESGGHIHGEDCYQVVYFTDEEPYCGLKETDSHVHEDECWEYMLVCELDHEHTDECFVGQLVCGLEEGQSHTHTLECYPSMRELVCTLDESAGHVHDDSCYAMVLDCPFEHVHTEECFDEQGRAVCGFTETLVHQHTDECFSPRTIVVKAGHVHSDECQRVLICGKTEHIHTSACFGTVSAEEQMSGSSDDGSAPAADDMGQPGNGDSEGMEADISAGQESGEGDVLEEEDGGEEITEEETGENGALKEEELVDEDLSAVPGDTEPHSVQDEERESEDQDPEGTAGSGPENGQEEKLPDLTDEAAVQTETVEEDHEHGAAADVPASGESKEEALDGEELQGAEAGEDGSGELNDADGSSDASVSADEKQAATGNPDEQYPENQENRLFQEEDTDQQNSEQNEVRQQGRVLWAVPEEEGAFFAVLGLDEEIRISQLLEAADRMDAAVAGVETDSVSLQIAEESVVCAFAFRTASVTVVLEDEQVLRMVCAYDDGTAVEELWKNLGYDGIPGSLTDAGEADETDLIEQNQDGEVTDGAQSEEPDGERSEDDEEIIEENESEDSGVVFGDEEAEVQDEQVAGSDGGVQEEENESGDTGDGLTGETDLEETQSTDEETATEAEDNLATGTDLIVEEETGDELSGYDQEAENTEETVTDEMITEDLVEEEGDPGTELVDEAPESVILAYDADGLSVVISAGPEAGIPEGSSLAVNEIEDESQVREYLDRILSKTGYDEALISVLRLLDLQILDENGIKIEPDSSVSVSIRVNPVENTEMHVVHFPEQAKPVMKKMMLKSAGMRGTAGTASLSADGDTDGIELLECSTYETENGQWDVSFVTDGFSVFGIVGTTIEKHVLASDGQNYLVSVTYGSDSGIPENADLAVTEILPDAENPDSMMSEYDLYAAKTREALGISDDQDQQIRLFDIKIVDKDDPTIQYQPAEGKTVDVKIELADAVSEQFSVVHFSSEEYAGDVLEDAVTDGRQVSFEAGGFSVYAVAYTVDFHYEVNGKMYEFSIPGGGFVTLQQLVEVLGIANDVAYSENMSDDAGNSGDFSEEADGFGAGKEQSVNSDAAYMDVEISEKTREFIADVAGVKFSNSDLVWVGKTEESTTVGELKDAGGLKCHYSVDLTEEQIEEINAQTVESGDWALISLQPFETEECLTITMGTGEVFTLKVTDAQISTHVLTADGKDFVITVTYGPEAEIPNGSKLHAAEILEGSEKYEVYYEKTLQVLQEQTAEENYLAGLDFARFFDVTIYDSEGVKIEPKAPVEVKISYADPVEVADYVYLKVVHFAAEGTEVIDIDNEDSSISEIIYEQNGFSVIGTVGATDDYGWPQGEGNPYVMILQSGNTYYAVAHDGSLREVHYLNGTVSFMGPGTTTLEYLDDYLWDYTVVSSTRHTATLSTSGEDTPAYIDPVYGVLPGNPDTLISPAQRTLYINNGQIYATYYGTRYTLSAEGGELNRTTVDASDASPIFFAPLSGFIANSSESEGYDFIDIDTLIEEWKRQMTLDMVVDKTAEVYDYENRIYQVDLGASSGYHLITPALALEFVVDASRSMYFPENLYEHATYRTLEEMRNWITTNGNSSQTYYVITDPNNKATNYTIYYNTSLRGWYVVDAAYHHAPDGVNQDGTALNQWSRDEEYDGKIYIADEKVEGQPWCRLDYMRIAVEAAARVLFAVDPSAQIGLVSFNANDYAYGPYTQTGEEQYAAGDMEDLIEALNNISLAGGTQHDKGLNRAVSEFTGKFHEITNCQSAVVLITDGAPNGTTWTDIRTAAATVKNMTNAYGQQTRLFTLGLSLENIGSNKQQLAAIATDSNHAFNAERSTEVVSFLTKIIEGLVIDANLNGNVTDVIDAAFYPVNSATGLPLESGTWITLEGEVTTAGAQDAKGQVINDSGTWTVIWQNQLIEWPTYTDDTRTEIASHGWNGRVYLKAQEDFLGGNDINTNADGSKAEAIEYINPRTQEHVEISDEDADKVEEFDTPYVNVDELLLDENSTEWTVYLGESVDPKTEVQNFISLINVYEVVTDVGSLVYPLTAGSTTNPADKADTGTTFKLDTIIGTLTDADWTSLINGVTKEIEYTKYGHTPGYITISLTQDVVSGEDDLTPSPHNTAVVGEKVEKYTLTVKYEPVAASIADYHTGTNLTSSHGADTDNSESDNIHIINVFGKGMQITKTDESYTNGLKGSKFVLYRTAREGDDTSNVTTITGVSGNYYPAAELDLSDDTSGVIDPIEKLADGETYYLVETKAPDGYIPLNYAVPVTLTITNSFVPKPGTDSQSTKPTSGIYDWTQTAALTVDTSGGVKRTDADNTTDLTHTAVIPDSENTILYFRIANSTGHELPNTGGPGTRLFTIFGSFLILGAGVLLWRRRRLI